MANDPPWRLMLLKERRDIHVDDDVAHWSQAQRGVAGRPQVGQKRFQPRIRLPNVSGQLPGIGPGSACSARGPTV
jgi:hypothetical protein